MTMMPLSQVTSGHLSCNIGRHKLYASYFVLYTYVCVCVRGVYVQYCYWQAMVQTFLQLKGGRWLLLVTNGCFYS